MSEQAKNVNKSCFDKMSFEDMMSEFEHGMKIQALKYAVGKQMFCPYSKKVLDYRNAIEVTLRSSGEFISCRVIDGSFEDKIPELEKTFTNAGYEVEIFANVKQK